MQPTLHFLLFKNCKNGYALPSKSRIAKFFPRLSSGGFWKGRFENWAELQTYLRRDIRQSGKSDFRWSTSAGFPVFIQSGINYPPGRLLWQSADNQMVQTVRLEACGASYQTKRTQNIFMLSYPLTYSILLSPTSQRLAVHPLSPERETFEPLPLSIQIYSVRLRCLFSPRYLYLRQKMYIYYFMLYLAESLTVQSYTERKLIRHFPLWRERGTIEDGGK